MPFLSWVETGLKTNNFPIFFQQKHEFLSLFFLSTCASKHSATLRAVCASLLPLTQSNPCLIHFARNRSLMFDSDSFPSPLLHSGFFSFVETLLPYFSGYTMWKLAENQAQLEFRTDFVNLRGASIGVVYHAPTQPDTNKVSLSGSWGLTQTLFKVLNKKKKKRKGRLMALTSMGNSLLSIFQQVAQQTHWKLALLQKGSTFPAEQLMNSHGVKAVTSGRCNADAVAIK